MEVFKKNLTNQNIIEQMHLPFNPLLPQQLLKDLDVNDLYA